MQEAARRARNAQRLGECYHAFADEVRQVVAEMEEMGFRPRIQAAHRTIEDQLEAFRTGHSRVKFGFHNCTSRDGSPESLAVDLIDDDNPLASGRRYVIMLAHVAAKHGLRSGIFFDLKPQKRRELLQQAIAARNFDPRLRIGFDPTHIESTGITIAGARDGDRPHQV